MVCDRETALALLGVHLAAAPAWSEARVGAMWQPATLADHSEVVGITRVHLEMTWREETSRYDWREQTMRWELCREGASWPALTLSWEHREKRAGNLLGNAFDPPLGHEMLLVHASLASVVVEHLVAAARERCTRPTQLAEVPGAAESERSARPSQLVAAHWTRDGKLTAPAPVGASLAADVLRPRAVALGGARS